MVEVELEQAEATYQQHLGDLAPWAGCFAVVTGRRLVGIFSTYAVADDARRSLHDPESAVIRQIDREPPELSAPVLTDGISCLRIGGYPVYHMPVGLRYAA